MPNGDINGFTFTGSSFDGTAKNTDTSQSAPVSRFGNTSDTTMQPGDFIKTNAANNARISSLRKGYDEGEINPDKGVQSANTLEMMQQMPFVRQGINPMLQTVTADDNVNPAVKGTSAIVQGLLGGVMSPYSEASEAISKTGSVGKQIADVGNQVMNTPFELAKAGSQGIQNLFNAVGIKLPTVGSPETDKALNDAAITIGTLLLMGYSGDVVKNLVLDKYPEIKQIGERDASTVRGNQEVIPQEGKEPERSGEVSGNDLQRTQTGGSQAGDERIGQQGTEKKTTQNVEGINQGFTEVKPITKQGEQTPEGFTEVKPTTKELPKFSNPRNPKPAKAASDINKALVAKGFEELPPDEISNYSSITKEDQINKSATLLETDYEASKNMAKTGKGIPRGVNPQVLFNAVKNKALSENDYETLKDLASSPIARARSKAAQTLGASGFNNTASELDPVQIMQDVERAKENNFQQRTGAKDIDALKNRTVDQISKQIKKHNLQPKDWTSFIESIRCK